MDKQLDQFLRLAIHIWNATLKLAFFSHEITVHRYGRIRLRHEWAMEPCHLRGVKSAIIFDSSITGNLHLESYPEMAHHWGPVTRIEKTGKALTGGPQHSSVTVFFG
jgi:hypothetical protein